MLDCTLHVGVLKNIGGVCLKHVEMLDMCNLGIKNSIRIFENVGIVELAVARRHGVAPGRSCTTVGLGRTQVSGGPELHSGRSCARHDQLITPGVAPG